MAVWPWLGEQLDRGWPTLCPACGAGLELHWLTTTTRTSDGARRPGVGLRCVRCEREYDWSDEDGYELRRRRFRHSVLGPDARPKS